MHNEKRKIQICSPAKTGTSNWHMMMIAIQKNQTIESLEASFSRWGTNRIYKWLLPYYTLISNALKSTSDLELKRTRLDIIRKSIARVPQKFSHISKIITVRHPLARLQSCHRDKFSLWKNGTEVGVDHNHHVEKKWQEYWSLASTHETSSSLASKQPLEKVSLQAFLEYITTGYNYLSNPHWKPIHISCSCCLLDYNYIVKLETAHEDAGFLKKELDVEGIGEFPGVYSGSEHAGGGSVGEEDADSDRKNREYIAKLKNLYRDIPKKTILKVFDIYKWDFLLFDYDLSPFL